MKTIWKYELPTATADFSLYLRKNDECLHVGVQNGTPCLWVEVNTDEEEFETRQFYWVGTGRKIPSDNYLYLGTVLLYSDTLVLHLYEGM